MKYFIAIARVLFIVCLPVLFLSTSIRVGMGSASLYQYSFDNYSVSRYTGISTQDLAKVAGSLAQYLKSDERDWRVTVDRNGQESQLLGEREVAHFRDVKGLFRLDVTIQMVSLAYVLAFMLGMVLLRRREGWRQALTALRSGSILAIALMFLLGAGMLIGFDRLLLSFHLTFFSNDLWIAQPGDIMTTLFPGYFLRDAAAFIAGGMVVQALVVGSIAWLILKKKSRANPRPDSTRPD